MQLPLNNTSLTKGAYVPVLDWRLQQMQPYVALNAGIRKGVKPVRVQLISSGAFFFVRRPSISNMPVRADTLAFIRGGGGGLDCTETFFRMAASYGHFVRNGSVPICKPGLPRNL